MLNLKDDCERLKSDFKFYKKQHKEELEETAIENEKTISQLESNNLEKMRKLTEKYENALDKLRKQLEVKSELTNKLEQDNKLLRDQLKLNESTIESTSDRKAWVK